MRGEKENGFCPSVVKTELQKYYQLYFMPPISVRVLTSGEGVS